MLRSLRYADEPLLDAKPAEPSLLFVVPPIRAAIDHTSTGSPNRRTVFRSCVDAWVVEHRFILSKTLRNSTKTDLMLADATQALTPRPEPPASHDRSLPAGWMVSHPVAWAKRNCPQSGCCLRAAGSIGKPPEPPHVRQHSCTWIGPKHPCAPHSQSEPPQHPIPAVHPSPPQSWHSTMSPMIASLLFPMSRGDDAPVPPRPLLDGWNPADGLDLHTFAPNAAVGAALDIDEECLASPSVERVTATAGRAN